MESEANVFLPVAVTINDSSGDNSDTQPTGSAATSTNNATGCQPGSSTEKFNKNTLFRIHFVFRRVKEHLKEFGYLLVSVALTKKSVPAINLESILELMIKKRRKGLLPTFDKLCQENNSRKSKKPETKAATEPTFSKQSNVKKTFK